MKKMALIGFHKQIQHILQFPATERYDEMVELHRVISNHYCDAVNRLTPEKARSISPDGRELKLVIGHIMEWERYTLFCLAQLISGVRNQTLLWENGYVDLDGKPHSFASIDEFNAFQREKQANMPWGEIQSTALQLSQTLYKLFSKKGLFTPELLEKTEVISQKQPDGSRIPIPLGYTLWSVILEHEAVDHAADLYTD
jgi:hypothetical protein